jgi:hypothetical protein
MTYHIEWGDGEVNEGNIKSGEVFTLNHSWNEEGEYIIRAKLTDIYGAEGNCTTFDINIPRNTNLYFKLKSQFQIKILEKLIFIKQLILS